MAQKPEQGANPLGYEPLPKLLRGYAIPSVIAMLVSSLYNIVDQIFIGQGVGYLGNAATNVAFSTWMLVMKEPGTGKTRKRQWEPPSP